MNASQTAPLGFRRATEVSFSEDGGSLTARISGEIDHHSARRIREEIDMEVFRRLPNELILDLSGVGFMDSAGLGLILGRLNLMNDRHGRLRITGLTPSVGRILSLAGIERLPGIALDRAAKEPFDIVMTDVWMPGQNGMQLAAELRKQAGGRRIRVYAVTADVDFIKSRDADNFDGCLLKPITRNRLRELLCQSAPAEPPPEL